MKKQHIHLLFALTAALSVVNLVILLGFQGPLNPAWAAVSLETETTEVPRIFSYQGTLRDANGDLIDGSVDLTLKLYDTVTGGTALYTESFTDVNVRSGVFNVVVGDTTPIPASVFDNFPLYLGLSVNLDDEMLPRQRLHPVPYAMQATSAETAVTATNLVQGGGVPNLLTFGASGASEIAFGPNGGSITNDANGLALNGGTDSTVSTAGDLTVGGDLTVQGDWSAEAIRDVGDSNSGTNQRSNYPVSLNRYVVEAPDAGSSPDTVPVDDAILTELCSDEDGCLVSLYMRDWNDSAARGLLAGAGPHRMTLAAADLSGNRQWAIYGPDGTGFTGTDKDNALGHLMNVFNSCFFTDTEHNNAVPSDNTAGFGLLNWFGAFSGAYDSLNMTCVLIIED